MEHNFQPLLFGGDINVYSVARAFHEAYGVRSVCYGKFATGPAYGYTIIDSRVCPDNEDAGTFRKNVAQVAGEFPDKTVLVIGCGDSYVKLAAENKDQFPPNCLAATVSGELINTLIHKEKFYALCAQRLVCPSDIPLPSIALGDGMADQIDFHHPLILVPIPQDTRQTSFAFAASFVHTLPAASRYSRKKASTGTIP